MKKIIFIFLLATFSLTLSCSKIYNRMKLNETENSCDFISDDCRSDQDVINSGNCYKVYSDVHIFGGWREIEGLRGNLIYEKNPDYKEHTYYIGDIYDLENAKDSDVDKAKEKIDTLRMEAGDNYVRGNHEMDAFGDAPFFTKVNGVLFTHGHHITWHEDQNRYWESGKQERLKKGRWDDDLTEKESIQKALELAEKETVHTLVFGHTHPWKLSIRKLDGVTLINVRKGCTYLNISEF